MRIDVSALLPVESGNLVEFRCSVGVGAGMWRSEELPQVGHGYDVELDVDAEEATDVRLRLGGAVGIRLDGERVVFGGRLRLIPDGAVYLEVGGTTVSVDLPEGIDLPAESDELVELTTARTSVHLFPFVL